MGRDLNGPTATVKSVASIEQSNFHDGALFNLRFDPKGIEGEKGLQIVEGVIKTYFENGGEHIQINVVDDETLKKAQQKPEGLQRTHGPRSRLHGLLHRAGQGGAGFHHLPDGASESLRGFHHAGRIITE